MRRLLRPWPLLLVAYLAATVALAFTLPPRPSVEFTDADMRSSVALVGFSPDGRRLATFPAYFPGPGDGPPQFKAPMRVREVSPRLGPAPFVELLDTETNYAFVSRPNSNAVFWRHFDDPAFARRLADLGLARPDTLEPLWLELSPDGRYCAAHIAKADDTLPTRDENEPCVGLGAWEIATGQLRVAVFPDPGDKWDFTADGKTMTTTHCEIAPDDKGCDVHFRAWDLATGRVAWESKWDIPLGQRHFPTPDGRRRVECVFGDGDTQHWKLRDTVSGSAVKLFDTNTYDCPIVRGGRAVVVWHDRESFKGTDSMRVLDFESGAEVAVEPKLPAATFLGQVQAVSPDGSMFVARTWTESRTEVESWIGGALRSLGIDLNDDDGETLLIDAATGAVPARQPGTNQTWSPGPYRSTCTMIAFSNDGRRLAVSDDHGTVRVWDLPIGRPWAFATLVAAVPALALAGIVGVWRSARRRASKRG